jgi:purine-binding chemotaxis protein CheW
MNTAHGRAIDNGDAGEHQRRAASSDRADLSLICRVHRRLCALPLRDVIETMRPLPMEVVAGAPHFVRGLAVIRGEPVPVVDAARLLGEEDAPFERWITLTVGARQVALAVGGVLGVRRLPADARRALPPLLSDVSRDLVSGLGLLDESLLLVLQGGHLLSDDAWASLDLAGTAA